MEMHGHPDALGETPEIDSDRVRPESAAIRPSADERVGALTHAEPQQLFGLGRAPPSQLLDCVLPQTYGPCFPGFRAAGNDLLADLFCRDGKSDRAVLEIHVSPGQ